MDQAGPNDALQHRSRREHRRFEQRAGAVSVLLTAAMVIGLHAAWFGWQTGRAPVNPVTSAMAARHYPVLGTASF